MVLKTIGPKGPGGSNPSLSAMRAAPAFRISGRGHAKKAASAAKPYHRRFAPGNLAELHGARHAGDLGVFQRGHVDHEAVFHVALEHAFVGFVDLVHADQLDVGGDVMLTAEIEHLLRLSEAADERAREAPAPKDQRERSDGQRFLGGAD